ncbi:iron-containing alcohol dehydrogenase family protein [Anthocerotibacter panamensis]|uniref:iron-containing alcohol dehydrogenase family protein n=1 Tax=Anthocerotibacter panamensis TaxID=2857077 RepID=UPI001C4084AC|nr:iron-containing alcohol dehydrogenase family protein [Anthocerotibacter panamensis]
MQTGKVSTLAPQRVVRGWGVCRGLGEALHIWGARVLVVSGARTQERFAPLLQPALQELETQWGIYGGDCTEAAQQRLVEQAQGAEVILGVGGGKALDMAKWVAQTRGLPVVTLPTSAATCAAWAPLSNVYSAAGTWLYGVPLTKAPELLVVDYHLLLSAPPRTLVAGVGDALAKWYEASVSSAQEDDPLVIAAVQQARTLRDLLLLKGAQALREPGGRAWEQVIDANICLAGLVGGLGGDRCRTVAAHAVHNALTTLHTTRHSLHGEKVAYGILVQLRLEEMAGNRLAEIARQQLLKFYWTMGLPTRLADLDLGPLSLHDLRAVAESACAPGTDLHLLPFPVTPQQLIEALVAEETGTLIR